MKAIGTQLRDPINLGMTQWHMAVFNKYMDAAAELGRNPVSKHQIQLEYGDEQANAGRDCRRIGNLTRLIHTLAVWVTIHTYIHT